MNITLRQAIALAREPSTGAYELDDLVEFSQSTPGGDRKLARILAAHPGTRSDALNKLAHHHADRRVLAAPGTEPQHACTNPCPDGARPGLTGHCRCLSS